MSTSELFALRNKLQKSSFEQFKKYIREENKKLDSMEISNLFLHAYTAKQCRKHIMDYLLFFVEMDKNVLHIEVGSNRRLLQDLCYNARASDVRQLIEMFLDFKMSLKMYNICKLIAIAIDGKGSSGDIANLVYQFGHYQKYFPELEEERFICLKALRRDMLVVAQEIIKNNIGSLTNQHEELFALPYKIAKKDIKVFQSFLEEYFERTRTNPYIKDVHGRYFWDKMSKDLQQICDETIRSLESRMEQREPVRRSENKVRSSMGQGQNLKQYNSEALHQNSREKMVINIQNSEDELSIQREANKIYENIVTEKEKYYRYEKKQKKDMSEKSKRTGIMKSEELRYYLEEDIQLEVEAIKEENRQYKSYFIELINKLKEKLTTPLNIVLEVFGSFRTELCLQESDIDIAVTSDNEEFQMNPLKLLGEIEYILMQQEMKQYIQNVKFIKTATVPIIKVTCTEKYWRKKIDFTYQDGAHNGLQSVELIRQYLQIYPQLESLIFVLKKFIYLSNLSAPYLGGISSYGLILMIVAYIQQEYKQADGEGQRMLTSDLLIGFLKFYGFKMNYVMKCIQIFDKNKTSWQNYNSCVSNYSDPNSILDLTPKLVIIDPLNDVNNVGRPTHKIKQIQMAFEIAFISIHTYRQCGKKRKCASYRKIHKAEVSDMKYADSSRPCCLLKRMFSCTEKFIKE